MCGGIGGLDVLEAENDVTDQEARQGHGFGTAPVFLASISTILGAVMFLRVG